jgi:hypothetical protein
MVELSGDGDLHQWINLSDSSYPFQKELLDKAELFNINR